MLMLSAVCCLSGLTGCAHRDVSIVPDSREIVDLSSGSGPRPGWYGISSGYLREIFRDLQKCGEVQK
jgi:hypothetical protein